MSLFGSMRVSAAGMTVERFRMDVTSENLANANTEPGPGEKAFAKQLVEVEAGPEGPRIVRTLDAPNGTTTRPDPNNPGTMVTVPNINPVSEMLDMMGATRAYEANVKAFNAAKGMAKSALDIGKA